MGKIIDFTNCVEWIIPRKYPTVAFLNRKVLERVREFHESQLDELLQLMAFRLWAVIASFEVINVGLDDREYINSRIDVDFHESTEFVYRLFQLSDFSFQGELITFAKFQELIGAFRICEPDLSDSLNMMFLEMTPEQWELLDITDPLPIGGNLSDKLTLYAAGGGSLYKRPNRNIFSITGLSDSNIGPLKLLQAIRGDRR